VFFPRNSTQVYKQMLNRQKCIYTSQDALTWMINVAEGMQYLHNVSESKPMIIHRDLKLENIMLSAWGNVTIAKLVDFGLHKVIDDRIKKVVKRVASEAFLGAKGMLSRRAVPVEEIDEDDELEVALAQQRAEKAKAEGIDLQKELEAEEEEPPSTPSPSGRRPLGRQPSRLHLASPAMAAHKEEEEEGEEAADAKTGGGENEVTSKAAVVVRGYLKKSMYQYPSLIIRS